MAIHTVKLTGKRQIANGTMEFLFEKPAGFKFRAGQFLDVMLPERPGAPKSDYIHGFSIVAAPYEDYLAVATRLRGSPFKESLRALPEGGTVRLDASYGEFVLPKETARPVVFLIGGIGVTPVRSMIAQSGHDRTGHRLMLIHANRSAADAPFTDDFQGLARDNPNFTFLRVLEEGTAGEGVAIGRVDAALIRRHVPDLAGSLFYLSGPPGMVRAMRTILMDELKVDEDRIRTEEFDGY